MKNRFKRLPSAKSKARAGILPGGPGLTYQPASALTGSAKAVQNVTYFKNIITHNVLNGSLKFEDTDCWFFERNNVKPECSSKVKRRQYE